MAQELNAGSSLVRMVLMLKVLAFMAAKAEMILTEMMLNRFFFFSFLSMHVVFLHLGTNFLIVSRSLVGLGFSLSSVSRLVYCMSNFQ